MDKLSGIYRQKKVPEWLSTNFILNSFGGKTSIAHRKYKNFEEGDKRNIPAIRGLSPKLSLDVIERVTRKLIDKNSSYSKFVKKISMYIGQNNGGLSLREIGDYYQKSESAISQSNKHVKIQILDDKKLKKIIEAIKNKIKMSNVET